MKRSVYEKYGLLNLDFPLAADYELMLRFLYRHEISTSYITEVLVKMRTGGTSRPGMYTLRSVIENYRAWKVNGLSYPPYKLAGYQAGKRTGRKAGKPTSRNAPEAVFEDFSIC